MSARRTVFAIAAVVALAASACTSGGEEGPDEPAPLIVVTTTILGDVVRHLVGPDAEVVTLFPVGASPHDFQASARESAQLRDADLVIVNGGLFEAGISDLLRDVESEGVPVYEAISAVESFPLMSGGGQVDPHFFTAPADMADAVVGIAAAIDRAVPSLASPVQAARVDDYLAELRELDVAVGMMMATLPSERRVVVTDHDVFAYFARRYDFVIAGQIVAGGSTGASVGAGSLAELESRIASESVAAIFVEAGSSLSLVETLSSDAGDLPIVELFVESLGGPDSRARTYVEMINENVERIVAALG